MRKLKLYERSHGQYEQFSPIPLHTGTLVSATRWLVMIPHQLSNTTGYPLFNLILTLYSLHQFPQVQGQGSQPTHTSVWPGYKFRISYIPSGLRIHRMTHRIQESAVLIMTIQIRRHIWVLGIWGGGWVRFHAFYSGIQVYPLPAHWCVHKPESYLSLLVSVFVFLIKV